MQLDQIDPVGAQPFQRALDLVVGLGPSTFTGLGGEKELVAVSLDPGTKSQLCVAVACGGVDVVDPMLADQLDRLIRLVLADVAQGGSAEDHAGALMAGRAERLDRNHGCHSVPTLIGHD